MPRYTGNQLSTTVPKEIWRGTDGMGVVVKNHSAVGTGYLVYLANAEFFDAAGRDFTLDEKDTLVLDPPLGRRKLFALVSDVRAEIEVLPR